MRRRFSLLVVAVLVVLALLASTYYLSLRTRGANRIASTRPAGDSIARLDSAARQEPDTMCFAARIGLPCDTR